mmetsp:Transcript_20643/g.41931  ORF Transcript_20643/g.41931 Transcript_20643/m.41931 type:complete len:702 (+) Transcript_20643:130-2235(+)
MKPRLPSPPISPLSKLTPLMRESLETLRSSLLCPLCNHVMTDPSTLTCAHSFCLECIKEYTCDHWYCPVVGCGMPVCFTGGKGKAFVNKNPQISAVVLALKNIQSATQNAPDKWWEDGNVFCHFDQGCGCDLKESSSNEALDKSIDDVGIEIRGEGYCNDWVEKNGKRKRLYSYCNVDDESSTTQDVTQEQRDLMKRHRDNSFAPSPLQDCASKQPEFNCTTPPNFSPGCSTIAILSSQPSDSTSLLTSRQVIDEKRDEKTSNKDDTFQVLNTSTTAMSEAKTELKPLLKSFDVAEKKNATNCSSGKSTKRVTRVSFQPLPKVMLLYPPWTLKAAQSRCLRQCIANELLTIAKMPIHSSGDDLVEFDATFDIDTEEGRVSFLEYLSHNQKHCSFPVQQSFYAVSTERDYATCDGVVVPRSFQYYLAVACGLPIVDIEFLSLVLKKQKSGKSNHERYPFPSFASPGENSSEEVTEEKKYHVIGASGYEWNAPQKSRVEALKRHTIWSDTCDSDESSHKFVPGTNLLGEYTVIMTGQFDHPAVKKLPTRKRQQHFDGGKLDWLTKGRIGLLLQLCGARVYDIDVVTKPKQLCKGLKDSELEEISDLLPLAPPGAQVPLKYVLQSAYASNKNYKTAGVSVDRNIVVLVKDATSIQFGRRLLQEYFSRTSPKYEKIPIVSCEWLLDSIGDFNVKEFMSYSDCNGV